MITRFEFTDGYCAIGIEGYKKYFIPDKDDVSLIRTIHRKLMWELIAINKDKTDPRWYVPLEKSIEEKYTAKIIKINKSCLEYINEQKNKK